MRRITIDDNIRVEQMKVLKVTNSPQKPDGRCTEPKTTPTMPCLKSQYDVFGIPSKPKQMNKQ